MTRLGHPATTIDEQMAAPDPADIAADDDISAEPSDVPDDAAADDAVATEQRGRGIAWSRVLAYGILPSLALTLALGAGYLKWTDASTVV